MYRSSPPPRHSKQRQRSSQQQRRALGSALLAGGLLFILSAWAFSMTGAPLALQRSVSATGIGDAASTATGLSRTSPAGNRPTLPAPGAGTDRPAVRAGQAAAEPIAVRIPAIGLESGLIGLGLNDDGTLEVPSDFDVAGWYARGPLPGHLGPALITGHVDSHIGPAAFFRLHQAKPGDEIFVDFRDGTSVRFLTERVERHPKAAFPTEEVYGDTIGPELRLVTCGGVFDPTTGHYRDNVIVWAS